MIIDYDRKFVFVSIPKTGSISIQFSLGHGDDIPEPDLYHQGIESIVQAHPEVRDFTKCAFVRNPWARLLSLYNDFTMKRIYQYSGQVRHDKPLFSEFTDFEDFCLNVKNSQWWMNIFLRSQRQQLSIGPTYVMDFVGRFERIEEDFKKMCEMVGYGNIPLQRMNVGTYDNTSYRQHYTERSKEAVGNLYKDDVELFGYEF